MSEQTPEKQSRSLPDKPGVYLFRDTSGTVIYVGKAANLHHRVRSYFSPQASSPKLQRLVGRIGDIDFIITGSEQEAFILENSLIKKHRPHFNVRLKDDKSYPYLKITLAEAWPRVHITRRLSEDGSRYFGPFASASSLRQTMSLLNKLFPYRTCKMEITGTQNRPCLKYHIKRCSGPCIGAVSSQEYLQIIDQVTLFLEGKYERVIRELKKSMSKASVNLEFEKAASLRDQIQAIENIFEQQKVVSRSKIDEDVIAIAQERNEACAQVFFIRGGKILGKERFTLENVQDESPDRIMGSFVKQFYGSGATVPPSILLQTEPEDALFIQDWLQEKRGCRVRLLVPRRGEKKKLMGMVSENATESLEQMKIKRLADSGKTAAAMEELKSRLELPRLPRRIECYDISNIRGTAAVGSMAVFEEGQPKPSLYRRFKIKSVSGIDDYAMMQEVLWRRFGKGTRSEPPSPVSDWAKMPDLVLIDGGRGHLNAILEVMSKLGMDDMPLASIAKENEEIFLPHKAEPVILPANSQALFLLQRIRDEAHRFAISYHIRTRTRAGLKSGLDEVPGIGPQRKKELLKRFGSVRGVREASIDDIASVSGMTRALAEKVKDQL
ncbi:MAG: excinuclease ABC subunit UvrC [Dehalococcoidia bacterium]|nr:excinuclease ABC subunit UvrC [Dehalococcoidia bacterium]